MTLSPALLKKLLAARPESATLALAKYRQDYKNLSGMAITVDHDQQMQLLERTGANESGMWSSRYAVLPSPWREMQSIYTTGFMARTPSDSILEDLLQPKPFSTFWTHPCRFNSHSSSARTLCAIIVALFSDLAMHTLFDNLVSLFEKDALTNAWLKQQLKATQISLEELGYRELLQTKRILSNSTGVALYWFQSFVDMPMAEAMRVTTSEAPPVKFIVEHGLTGILLPTEHGDALTFKLCYHWRILDPLDVATAPVATKEGIYDTARKITAYCFTEGFLNTKAQPLPEQLAGPTALTILAALQLRRWEAATLKDEQRQITDAVREHIGVAGENRLALDAMPAKLNSWISSQYMGYLTQSMFAQIQRQAQLLALNLGPENHPFLHDVNQLSSTELQARFTRSCSLLDENNEDATALITRVTWLAVWNDAIQRLHLALRVQLHISGQSRISPFEHHFELAPVNLSTANVEDMNRIEWHAKSLQPGAEAHDARLTALLNDALACITP